MAKLKHALVACVTYIVAIAAVYGTANSIGGLPGSRQNPIDVLSQAPSLAGGHEPGHRGYTEHNPREVPKAKAVERTRPTERGGGYRAGGFGRYVTEKLS